MTTPEILLVPIDFSESSHAALALARVLGARMGLEIVLLHVYTIPLVAYPGTEPLLYGGLTADIAAAAKRALDDLAAASGATRTLMREGTPVTEILAAIREVAPMMVVMGTHGRRGVAHFVLGSVAERVVQQSPVPVLTVHGPPPTKKPDPAVPPA